MSLDLETAPTFPGSFHAVAPSSKSTSTPSQQPQVEGDWENEENIDEPVHRRSTPSRRSNNDEAGHIVSSPGLPLSSRTSTVSDRASPSDSAISSPSRAQRIPTRRRVPRRQVTPISSPFKQKTPLKSPIRSSSAGTTSILSSTISLLFSSLSIVISVMHVILRPILPYVLLALLLSSAILYLPPRLPSLLLKIIGYVLHKASSSWLDSLAWWPSLINGDRDIALARGLALLPLRGLATPACALTGLACHLSLLSTTTTEGNYIRLAQPVWKSVNQPVDVAGVARNLTKDVKGARDIFESIAMLSEGGMMDRLEYVRWVCCSSVLFVVVERG